MNALFSANITTILHKSSHNNQNEMAKHTMAIKLHLQRPHSPLQSIEHILDEPL